MIRVVHPGSGSWLFTHPRFRVQGSKRHWIPDPRSGSATLDTRFLSTGFFHGTVAPPQYTMEAILNFQENSLRYSEVKVYHQFQRHQWKMRKFWDRNLFHILLLSCVAAQKLFVMFLCLRRRNTTNTAPTTLRAIQADRQSTFINTQLYSTCE